MGQEFSSHGEKANILWVAFKDRMGLFEYTHMYIDLHQLFQADLNLKSLEVPSPRRKLTRLFHNFQMTSPQGLMASMESSSKNVGSSLLMIFIICVQAFMKEICV
jgi:hypothetical protein